MVFSHQDSIHLCGWLVLPQLHYSTQLDCHLSSTDCHFKLVAWCFNTLPMLEEFSALREAEPSYRWWKCWVPTFPASFAVLVCGRGQRHGCSGKSSAEALLVWICEEILLWFWFIALPS